MPRPSAKRFARPASRSRSRSRSVSFGPARRFQGANSIQPSTFDTQGTQPMDYAPSVRGSSRSALKQLSSAWASELHDIGFGYAMSNQPTAATIVGMSQIVQGDLQGNRAGARVALNRIGVCYAVQTVGAGVAIGSRVRVALLWDKEANGVLPTEAMIQENFATGNDTQAIMPNFNYRDRLKVLYDQTHVVTPTSNPLDVANFTVDLTGKVTTYVSGAGAGTYADVITGGLVWYVKADGNNTTGNAVQAALYFHP